VILQIEVRIGDWWARFFGFSGLKPW